MVFYQAPLTTNAFATSVLQILSNGAAAELERRRDHRHMHQLAYTDSTTGLPNRVQFMEHLREMGQQAQKQQSPLALLLLDCVVLKKLMTCTAIKLAISCWPLWQEGYAI